MNDTECGCGKDKEIDYLSAKCNLWKACAEKLAKALKAQVQMRDMKKPQKLYEALAWRDNDDLAAKWVDEALAEFEKETQL